MTVDQGARLQRLIDELLLVAAAEHSNVQLQCERIDIAELFASIAAAGAAVDRFRPPRRARPTDVGRPSSPTRRRSSASCSTSSRTRPSTRRARRSSCAPTRAGAEVTLSVVDHGPGIPACDRERVFERFVQLDQSSTRRQGGTGLGLHLCKQLADLVDGRMALDETPGGGCTFSLTIPADTTAGRRRDRAVAVRQRAGAPRRVRTPGSGAGPMIRDLRSAQWRSASPPSRSLAFARGDIVGPGAGVAPAMAAGAGTDRALTIVVTSPRADHVQARLRVDPRVAPRGAGHARRIDGLRRRHRPRVARRRHPVRRRRADPARGRERPDGSATDART